MLGVDPPVFDPMRPVRVCALAAVVVLVVVLVIALEPLDVAESPSKARMWVAMRSRNQRSWEITTAQPANSPSSASSRARRVSTSRSLVGSSSSSRLPPSAQHLGQVDAVALAARERPTRFCWSVSLEVERAHVGARAHLALADHHPLVAAADLLPDGLAQASRARRATGRRRRASRSRPAQLPSVGLLFAGDHPEERGLAGAVGADDTDDAAARQ